MPAFPGVATKPLVEQQEQRLVLVVIGQALRDLAGQAATLRYPETNRVGHALALDRHAVMGPFGRQVEHVARLADIFLLGLEMAQDLERHVLLQAQVLLAADAPAALALGLDQEHVVAVEMRADAAALAGPGYHQVVQPRIGQEAELLHQRMRAVMVQVHALHQQAPVRLLEGREGRLGERPVLEFG